MKVSFNLGSVIGGAIPILAGLAVLYFVTNQPPDEREIQPSVVLKAAGVATGIFGMMGSIIYEEMQKQKKKRLEKRNNTINR